MSHSLRSQEFAFTGSQDVSPGVTPYSSHWEPQSTERSMATPGAKLLIKVSYTWTVKAPSLSNVRGINLAACMFIGS
jgi:hypothetical protein